MKSFQITDIIRLSITSYHGTEFQKFGNRLMTILYPSSYHGTRAGGPKGDFSNDGYCPKERIFFHFYGPERSRSKKLMDKMTADIHNCLKRQIEVRKIVYVSNDTFLGEIESHLDTLRTVHNLEIECWGVDRMVNLIRQLPKDHIEYILGRSLSFETDSFIQYQIDEKSVKRYSFKNMETGFYIFILSVILFIMTNILILTVHDDWYMYVLLFVMCISIFTNFKYLIMTVCRSRQREVMLNGLFSVKFYKTDQDSVMEYLKQAKCSLPGCTGRVVIGSAPINLRARCSAIGYCSQQKTVHTFSVSEDHQIGDRIQLNFTRPDH